MLGAAFVAGELGAFRSDALPIPKEAPAADILSFDKVGGNRMTVPVSVGGTGPYPFLVDTGAERTVISKELARRLALDAGRKVTLHSMTEVAEVPTAIIPRLNVSRKTLTNVQAPALSESNMGAAGMLGVDSLKSHRVMFDFRNATMAVVPSRKMERWWGSDAIVIKGRSLFGRLVLVDAQVDGQKLIVIMDTGSPISIGNHVLRRRLAARNRLKPTVPVELVSVTGGRLIADYTTVELITLSGIDIFDMPIGFADVHPFRQLQLMDRPALLLGMDVLQLFDRVSIDFARKQVRFDVPGNASGGNDSISARSTIRR